MKKEMTKAIPTVDIDGNVIQWDIEFTYTQDELTVPFFITVDIEASKKPNKYTKKELAELGKEEHWDNVFASMHASIHNETESETKRIDDFNLKSLS